MYVCIYIYIYTHIYIYLHIYIYIYTRIYDNDYISVCVGHGFWERNVNCCANPVNPVPCVGPKLLTLDLTFKGHHAPHNRLVIPSTEPFLSIRTGNSRYVNLKLMLHGNIRHLQRTIIAVATRSCLSNEVNL